MKRSHTVRVISPPARAVDMLVYLRNLPQNRDIQQSLLLPSSGEGDSLFRQKGCSACHIGGLALENRLGDSTLTDVAAAMWNHAPQMRHNRLRS